MQNVIKNRLPRYLLITAITTGSLTVALGMVVLVGWYTGNKVLIQVLPMFVPMQYNTALGFVLCGSGMLLGIFNNRHITYSMGILVILLGSLTILEYISGLNIGLDELFMKHDIVVKTSHPGRMAPNTAACFALFGGTLLFSLFSRKPTYESLYRSILLSLIFAFSIVALSGYITHLESAYGWGNLTRMAVHTSAGFVMLSIGLLSYLWRNDIDEITPVPYWLPIPVAIGALTITICLWQAHYFESEVVINMGNGISGQPYLLSISLIIGVLFSIVLGLTFYFAIISNKRTRKIAEVNENLASEISDRKHVEVQLVKYRDDLEVLVEERTKELKESQKKLLSSERLAVLGKLSSGIAHEIRNPLATIGSSAYFLSKKLKDADEIVLKNIDRIASEVKESTAIIQGLQDLATMDKPKKARKDIAVVIEETLKTVNIPEEVKVAMNIQKDEFFVDADIKQMSIMYRNLINNAVQAMDNRGSIRIIADRTESNSVEVSIRDSGPGIKVDDLKNVFTPFFGTKTTGFGFGLSICQMVIEKHGGEIDVKSEAGNGATFIVRYPSN